jgi:hypothetical protein
VTSAVSRRSAQRQRVALDRSPPGDPITSVDGGTIDWPVTAIIRKAIGWKRVFVDFVSDPTKNGNSPHQRRVMIRVKNEAHSHGK